MSSKMFREICQSGQKMTLTKWRQFGFKPKPGEQPELGNSSNAFTWSHLYSGNQMMRVNRR